MDCRKYIGLDTHQASISAAVMNGRGKLVLEATIETNAASILSFMEGLSGSVWVAFEEGTCAAWLYDLLQARVEKVIVCDPRRNALLKAGNKNDRVDARKLAELLRAGLLSPVYHGECGVRTLRELARAYLTVSKDLTRTMNRLKGLYRSWAIPCAGRRVYSRRHRGGWLEQLSEAGCAPARRVAVPTVRRFNLIASASTAGTRGRKPQTSGQRAAPADTAAGTGSRCVADRAVANAAPFPNEAAAMGLLRSGPADAHKC